jgi:hypothetical protein
MTLGPTQGAKRVCYFCGRTPLTGEDFLPRWIGKLFLVKGRRYGITKADYGAPSIVKRGQRKPEFPFKVVCETCNNDWMSTIENDVKSVLEPIIVKSAPSGHISEDQQRRLANWITLRAMIAEAASMGGLPCYDQSARDAFRNAKRLARIPPANSLVWIASLAVAGLTRTHDGTLQGTPVRVFTNFENRSVGDDYKTGGVPGSPSSWRCRESSGVLGHAAIQLVYWSGRDDPVDWRGLSSLRWQTGTTQVWPSSPSASWPLVTLSDSDALRFLRRFDALFSA